MDGTDTLRYNYRLRPGAQARAALWAEWGRSRWLWNQAVTASKVGYWLTDKDLTTWRSDPDIPWFGEGSVVVQQQTLRTFRVGTVRKKYKSRRNSPLSLQYTKRGFSIRDGRLKIAGGISIPVVWSRDLPSEPSSVRIYQDSIGDWYASFVVQVDSEQLPPTGKAVGIDWGVSTIAASSDGNYDLDAPEFGKKKQPELTRYQRMMARRKPKPGQVGSRGYRKAKRLAAKAYKKAARQRQDTARKWVRRVVADNDQIAVEDFKPKFLAKSTMARKASDNAIGMTKSELVNYAARAGRKVVLVPPAYTTMTCASCFAIAKQRLELDQRIFACTECGAIEDRDRNAARVILAGAGFNPAAVEAVSQLDPFEGRLLAEVGIPRL